MQKLKKNSWQLCHALLPTKATLSNRWMDIDHLCPFYQSEIEDQNHLFFWHCPMSQECWTLVVAHNWIDSSFVSSQQYIILQRLSSTRNATSATKIQRVVVLLWSIWKIRNSMVFCNETPISGSTLIRAKKVSAEWCIRHKSHNHFIHKTQTNQQSIARRLIG